MQQNKVNVEYQKAKMYGSQSGSKTDPNIDYGLKLTTASDLCHFDI